MIKIKKISILGLIAIFTVTFSGVSFALNSPVVVQDHGVITGMIISDNGLRLTGEYGLTSQLALIGTAGDPINRIGVKYEIDPNFAIVGGVTEDSPFIGINGSRKLHKDIVGLYEFDLSMRRDDLSLLYELGIKLNLDNNVDLRAGVIDFVEHSHFPSLEVGIGYKF
ncbi:hypothetical protein [Orenia marismortui]|uniref:hypothetical protein n=1 Tax=Orenia marismortui TaxID=46469 RepID=UPI000360E9C2|nr:hypothetical protein [Orenia marismortui]